MKFIMQYTYHVVLIFVLCVNFSCKTDKEPTIVKYDDDSEDQYFADYESPSLKWGLIDTLGNFVISPIYDDILEVVDTQYIAANLGGKWGYIDKTGKTVKDFNYKSVRQWSDDCGLVMDFKNNLFILHADGSLSDTLKYSEVREFKQGFAVARSSGYYVFIDKKGKQAFEGEFLSAQDFEQGTAIVKIENKGYGVINSKGDVVIDAKYKSMKREQKGYIVKMNDNTFTYLDRNGKNRFSSNFEKAFPFNYSHTIVQRNQNFELIDQKGKTVTEILANTVEYAGEKKWKSKKGNKWSILDSLGNQMCAYEFDNTYVFSEGFLAVSIGDKWGYIDADCHQILEPILPLAWSFSNGFCRVIDKGRYSVMNRKGDIIDNIRKIELRDFRYGLAKASSL